jgi:hypothetical protein
LCSCATNVLIAESVAMPAAVFAINDFLFIMITLLFCVG